MNRKGKQIVKHPESGLHPRHHKVVDAYFLNNFNKTEACRTAKYAHPGQKATAIFNRRDVQQEIQRRLYLNAQAWDIDEDWVIRRLAMLANGNLGLVVGMLRENGYQPQDLPPELQYCLAEFTEETYVEPGEDGVEVKRLKVKTRDQLGALVALSRHLGLFNDTLDVSFERTMVERIQQGRDRVAAEAKRGTLIEGNARRKES